MAQQQTSLTPLAFLGAGAVTQALVRGLLTSGVVAPHEIRVTNRADRERLDSLAHTFGVRCSRGKRETLLDARTVILATKPSDATTCVGQVRPYLTGRPLVISVVAGLKTSIIEDLLPQGIPVVRAMPNTSCGVGESATAISGGRWATAEHLDVAKALFGVVGVVEQLAEDCLDAVTGLSGSGPAYIYLMLEAMIEAGKSLGLGQDVSFRLALQTIRGAAATVQITGEDPAELRRKVTSPNGTTMAALAVLDRVGFKQGVIEAIQRAAARSAELAPAPAATAAGQGKAGRASASLEGVTAAGRD